MDLLYIWQDYRYWSKILFGTIHTHPYNLDIKVTDLEIYVKVLRQFFKIITSKSLHGFTLYLAWLQIFSKILFCTIPNPAYDLEVKVTDLCGTWQPVKPASLSFLKWNDFLLYL